MTDIVDKRLREYQRPFDQPSGFSSKARDMKRMADRASANSYHPPPQNHDKAKAPSSKNHVSSGPEFMPGTRRVAD